MAQTIARHRVTANPTSGSQWMTNAAEFRRIALSLAGVTE
jgi:hypothetical protein